MSPSKAESLDANKKPRPIEEQRWESEGGKPPPPRAHERRNPGAQIGHILRDFLGSLGRHHNS